MEMILNKTAKINPAGKRAIGHAGGMRALLHYNAGCGQSQMPDPAVPVKWKRSINHAEIDLLSQMHHLPKSKKMAG